MEKHHMDQSRPEADDVRTASTEGYDALEAWTIEGEYGADM
jgi:hypothetical protein